VPCFQSQVVFRELRSGNSEIGKLATDKLTRHHGEDWRGNSGYGGAGYLAKTCLQSVKVPKSGLPVARMSTSRQVER
jgi:hypothetical protein